MIALDSSGTRMNRTFAIIIVLPLGVGLCACEALESARGAQSLIQIVQGPTPTEATEWALDPYSPNNRYRGTMYLVHQSWAGAPEYLQLYVDAVADADATSIVGGGDTLGAIDAFGLAQSYSHISTGGGASLEFLSGKNLPGLVALNS